GGDPFAGRRAVRSADGGSPAGGPSAPVDLRAGAHAGGPRGRERGGEPDRMSSRMMHNGKDRNVNHREHRAHRGSFVVTVRLKPDPTCATYVGSTLRRTVAVEVLLQADLAEPNARSF